MATPIWSPGTLYVPGALVRPRSAPPVDAGQPDNPGFETGDLTSWSYTTTGGSATLTVQTTRVFQGANAAWWPGGSGSGSEGGIECNLVNDERAAVKPGQRITARCYIMYNPTGQQAGSQGRCRIHWYGSGGALIGTTEGNSIVGRGNNGKWVVSTASGNAPAGAAFASIGAWMTARFGEVYADAFSWDYAFSGPSASLIYKAVQANAGSSGSAEPAWPGTLGQTVLDNEVTWEAVETSRVVWEAHPILVSGSVEPTWPTLPGANVSDNSIVWEAVSRSVDDPKRPQSTVVAIAASKIFAGDQDIMSYSATVNPLDWSSRDDAGYLPFGLNTYGANPITACGLYRGNLVVFNSAAFQMWQVDEDPANMALLDAVPISCTYPRTVQAVANDLIFLNAVGIRNIGIAGASTNLQAGNFGEVVDALVTPKIRAAEDEPFSLYIPSRGQYWVVFGADAFVLTINGTKQLSWSRYTFPEKLTDWTLHGNALYLRTETDKVWELTDDAWLDDQFIRPSWVGEVNASLNSIVRTVGFQAPSQGAYSGAFIPTVRVTRCVLVYAPGSPTVATHLSVTIENNDGVGTPADTVDFVRFTDGAGNEVSTRLAGVNKIPGANSLTYEWNLTTLTDPTPIWQGGEDYRVEFFRAGDPDSGGVPFGGVVQWPFLDFGYMGVDKALEGFDVSADAPEGVDVSICYDQRDFSQRTPDYRVPGDTVPGFIVPMPVTAPSFSLRLSFPPGERWEWFSANLYLHDRGAGR